jgi:tyrosine-protein kinase Etk/Wzc
MSVPAPQKSGFVDPEDLRPILKFIGKNWYLMILFCALGLTYALIYTHRLPNEYAAKTEILLKSGETYDYQNAIYKSVGYYSILQDITNQKRVIGSHNIIRQVLERCDFTHNYYLVGRVKTEQVDRFAYFNISCPWSRMDRKLYGVPIDLKVLDINRYSLSYAYEGKKLYHEFEFGKYYEELNFHVKIDLHPGIDEFNLKTLKDQNFQFSVTSPDKLIGYYKNGLTIDNVNYTSILNLQVKDRLESRGRMFLDTLARIYIDYTLQNELSVNENTERYIDRQVDEITFILDSLETVLETFKDSKGILDLSREQSEAFKTMAEGESRLRMLEMRLSGFKGLEDFLVYETDATIVPPLYFVDGDQLLSKFAMELYELNQKRVNLLVSMKPIDKRVQQVDSTIKTVRNNIFRYITDNRTAIEQQKRTIQQQNLQLVSELKSIPRTQRDLLAIERKLAVNEKLYTFLLEKKANTIIARAGIIPQTSIIENARSLGVVGPNKKIIVYMAVGIGFVLAMLIGFIRLIFFERIESVKELKSITRLPIIGGVPSYTEIDEHPIVIGHNPRSNVSEAFRSIRTNMQFMLPAGNDCKVILVSSLHPSEGKTFMAGNFGAVLAKASKKVLLLDFDLHKPKIHKVFKLQNVAGLSSYLIGKTNYTDTIYHSQVENLDVITAGPVPPNASELVLNEKVDAMLADAKTRYDYIIIDTPPIMLISDSLVLMEKADLSLFVFNTAKATKAGVKHLEEVLSLNKQSKAAVVLNNTKISRWKYYYGKYAYKYGYGYGYGYGSYGSGAYGSNDYMEDSSRTKRKS